MTALRLALWSGLAAACGTLAAPAQETAPVYPPLDLLLQQSVTVIGQPFAYPAGTPTITAAVVTMVPGQQTGWHHHDAPLVGYILEGEVTVDYGPDGTRTYRAGDAFIEAFQTPHNGTNTGDVPVRILAVFAGATAAQNTVAGDSPAAN